MEGKIPEAPFSAGQKVWIRTCTHDMGLTRIGRKILQIFYEKNEWRIRFDVQSPESYPACYFQGTVPDEVPGRAAYIRLVPRDVVQS